MADVSVKPPNIISTDDVMGALLMEMRYTNYLLNVIIEGRGVERDSVAGFMAELTQQDIVGQPYQNMKSYAAKQPYSTTRT